MGNIIIFRRRVPLSVSDHYLKPTIRRAGCSCAVVSRRRHRRRRRRHRVVTVSCAHATNVKLVFVGVDQNAGHFQVILRTVIRMHVLTGARRISVSM
jgi:hypothetical protein